VAGADAAEANGRPLASAGQSLGALEAAHFGHFRERSGPTVVTVRRQLPAR